jgi:hypothetical protein
LIALLLVVAVSFIFWIALFLWIESYWTGPFLFGISPFPIINSKDDTERPDPWYVKIGRAVYLVCIKGEFWIKRVRRKDEAMFDRLLDIKKLPPQPPKEGPIGWLGGKKP